MKGEKGNKYDCNTCTERLKKQRNCENFRGYEQTLMQGEEIKHQVEFDLDAFRNGVDLDHQVPVMYVEKMGDLRFFECPLSVITSDVWELTTLVNECVDKDGTLIHLPYPGSITDQPLPFREAVGITRSERAEWQSQQIKNAQNNS